MSTTYHTAISSGAAADHTTFNTPLGTLDAAIVARAAEITALTGGATVTDALLKAWTESEAYEVIAVAYDADRVPTSATVKWPDGSAGTFTTTTKNSTWLAVDAYTISHADSGNTVTQAAVTRDANGQVTIKPVLTVA